MTAPHDLIRRMIRYYADRAHIAPSSELVAFTANFINEAQALTTAEASAQGEAGRWIPVGERLPDEGQLCVVLSEHWSGHEAPPEFAMREGKASEVVWKRFLTDETDDEGPPAYIEATVTHWVALLAPPLKGEL
jgi:hypothetical protein